MKYFIVFIFLTLCLVSSHSIDVKDLINSVTKITDTKTEHIKGSKTIMSNGEIAMKDLNQSIGLKTKSVFDNMKSAAKTKLDLISKLKAIKLSIVNGVAAAKYAKFTTIQTAKSALVNNYFAMKRAQLNKVVGKISTKSKDFYKNKLRIKGAATILFNSTVNKTQKALLKKKATLTLFHNSVTANSTIFFPAFTKQFQKFHRYNNESPIADNIFAQNLPIRTTEKSPSKPINAELNSSYGPPAETYGPPVFDV